MARAYERSLRGAGIKNHAGRPEGLVDDRYRIIAALGSGGMADVYLAFDERLGREVALKVLSPLFAGDREFVERFEREARAAAALSHPHIVSIHDRGEAEGGIYYIVMECVTGGTLGERIEERGRLAPPTALRWAVQTARALDFAHRRGVIHRDVKPENVLISASGDAKVADFGIARLLSMPTLTGDGVVMGSLRYLAPERLAGKANDPRSDLYSLGVVLHEMLTGRLPARAGVPVSPRDPAREIFEPIATIVSRLLEKDPGDRYPDAARLAENLERVREVLPKRTPPYQASGPPMQEERTRAPVGPNPPVRKRRGRWVFAGMLLVTAFLFLLAGVAGWGLLGWDPAQSGPVPHSDPGSEPGGEPVQEPPAPVVEDVAVVPDVSGEYFDPDAARWAKLGVTLRVKMARSSYPTGKVLYTEPAAGTEVEPDETVTVVISGSRSVVNPYG